MSRFNAPVDKHYTYVTTDNPTDPEEGHTWYDPGDDEARVYDGNSWQSMSITQHGSLSGIGANDHHSRPSSTAGIDAITDPNFEPYGGVSWSDGDTSTGTTISAGSNVGDQWTTLDAGEVVFAGQVRFHGEGQTGSFYIEINFTDGTSETVEYNYGSRGSFRTYSHTPGRVDYYRVSAGDIDDGQATVNELQPGVGVVDHTHSI